RGYDHGRTIGRGSLSVCCVLSGYVSFEYRKDFCCGHFRHGQCGSSLTCPDGRGGAGISEPVAVGSKPGELRAAVENGRGGRGTDFLRAVVNDVDDHQPLNSICVLILISPASPTRMRGSFGCVGGRL